jgi:8-amino-7-oxononanoate synthase
MDPSSMDFVFKKLTERKEEGVLRSLVHHIGKIDFSSNDYLGLASNPLLADAIQKKYHTHFPQSLNGSTGSRLLAGHHTFHDEVERQLAHYFDVEAVLIFNSGYVANLALLSTIPQKGDTIIMDEYIHASLKDGARLSFASKYSFKHNDLLDLENKLRKAEGNVFIVIETLYSMDGDFAPVEEISRLAKQYHAYLMVDEAHTTGIYGSRGNGYLQEKHVAQDVPFKVYTFGKAMGIHGACIAGSAELKEYLINFARPFIYTTAMSPHSFAAVAAAFEWVSNAPSLSKPLHKNIAHWNTITKGLKGFSRNNSAIQTYTLSGNEAIRALATYVQAQGYDVRAILSPTGKEGSERLRICLHAYNTAEEISGLVHLITSHHE